MDGRYVAETNTKEVGWRRCFVPSEVGCGLAVLEARCGELAGDVDIMTSGFVPHARLDT